jgi:hypothetical protein
MKETDEEGADGEAPAADQEAGPDQAALMKALLAAGAEKKGFAAPEELCQLFLSEGEAAPIPKSKLQNIFDDLGITMDEGNAQYISQFCIQREEEEDLVDAVGMLLQLELWPISTAQRVREDIAQNAKERGIEGLEELSQIFMADADPSTGALACGRLDECLSSFGIDASDASVKEFVQHFVEQPDPAGPADQPRTVHVPSLLNYLKLWPAQEPAEQADPAYDLRERLLAGARDRGLADEEALCGVFTDLSTQAPISLAQLAQAFGELGISMTAEVRRFVEMFLEEQQEEGEDGEDNGELDQETTTLDVAALLKYLRLWPGSNEDAAYSRIGDEIRGRLMGGALTMDLKNNYELTAMFLNDGEPTPVPTEVLAEVLGRFGVEMEDEVAD